MTKLKRPVKTYRVETQRHSLGINQQLISISLLLLNLLHLFLPEPGLLSFKSLLCRSSLLLATLVLLLLLLVFDLLVSGADRHWLQVAFEGLLDRDDCHLVVLVIFDAVLLILQLGAYSAERKLDLFFVEVC